MLKSYLCPHGQDMFSLCCNLAIGNSISLESLCELTSHHRIFFFSEGLDLSIVCHSVEILRIRFYIETVTRDNRRQLPISICTSSKESEQDGLKGKKRSG